MSNTDYDPGLVAGLDSYAPYAGALTAEADGTKANATPLNYGYSQIDTVAGAADSVLLPPALPRGTCLLMNNGANAMQVFGQGTDTINNVATGTGVSMAAGESAMLFCVEEGKWYGGVFTAF